VAEELNRTSNMKTWKTDPALGSTAIVVRKVLTTHEVGLPGQTVEEDWSARLESDGESMVIVQAASLAEMDAKLNAVRQIIVEARNGLAVM
jgi:hypothetical protein